MASINKRFYLESTDFSLRLARVVRDGNGGDVIEELRETSPGSPEEVRAMVQDFAQIRAKAKGVPGNYVRAHCAIYPKSRLLRNCSLKDPARPGEMNTLENVVTSQFRINPSEYDLRAMYADDGLEFEPSRVQRDLFVCGAPTTEFQTAQAFLVEAGVFPLRMELGSVATIGLILDAMRTQQIEEPALILEIGEDSSHVVIVNGNRVESARPLPLGLATMISGVRQELGLNDEGAARKLFYSDSFDFREMGPRLIDRLLREVQSMIGFYEVQTGQSITRMLCSLLPGKLSWLTETFASSLGMSRLDLNLADHLRQSNITLSDSIAPRELETRLGLLGLMVNKEVAQ